MLPELASSIENIYYQTNLEAEKHIKFAAIILKFISNNTASQYVISYIDIGRAGYLGESANYFYFVPLNTVLEIPEMVKRFPLDSADIIDEISLKAQLKYHIPDRELNKVEMSCIN